MLHENLKRLRKQSKITQENMTKQTGIARERIVAIEQGTGRFSPKELEAYLSAIDCKILILPSHLLQ